MVEFNDRRRLPSTITPQEVGVGTSVGPETATRQTYRASRDEYHAPGNVHAEKKPSRQLQLPGTGTPRPLPHEQTEHEFNQDPRTWFHGQPVPVNEPPSATRWRNSFGSLADATHAGTLMAAHQRLHDQTMPSARYDLGAENVEPRIYGLRPVSRTATVPHHPVSDNEGQSHSQAPKHYLNSVENPGSVSMIAPPEHLMSHREFVTNAIKKGLTVPRRVLDEYHATGGETGPQHSIELLHPKDKLAMADAAREEYERTRDKSQGVLPGLEDGYAEKRGLNAKVDKMLASHGTQNAPPKTAIEHHLVHDHNVDPNAKSLMTHQFHNSEHINHPGDQNHDHGGNESQKVVPSIKNTAPIVHDVPGLDYYLAPPPKNVKTHMAQNHATDYDSSMTPTQAAHHHKMVHKFAGLDPMHNPPGVAGGHAHSNLNRTNLPV